jgi:tryptophan synthase alpha chain
MTNLQKFIIDERESKSHLMMTHVVYGYPTIDNSLEIMQLMLDEGVELLEVQFPFSDPVADGPTITTACHVALEQLPELSQCLKDITQLAVQNPNSRVLLMSYLNPLLQMGFEQLAEEMDPSIIGLIIPDLPIDHSSMIKPLLAKGIAPIWLITPDMPDDRIQAVCDQATGMLYCVSRSGVTGQASDAKLDLTEHLTRVRKFTNLPLGVGFGINTSEDVSVVKDHADIAIVGSAFLNAYNKNGMEGVGHKLKELLS